MRELAWPELLPDGRHFLFTTAGSGIWEGIQDGIYVAPLDRRAKPRLLLPGAMILLAVSADRTHLLRDGVLSRE